MLVIPIFQAFNEIFVSFCLQYLCNIYELLSGAMEEMLLGFQSHACYDKLIEGVCQDTSGNEELG